MRRTLPLLALALAAPSAHAQFEAHEWGTFTSLVGSNGITQDGMYHEDEALPDFVHGFGVTQGSLAPPTQPDPQPVPVRPRPCHSKICFGDGNGDQFFRNNVITQKMETPVIYFYSDVPRSLDVNVRFPEGIVTETFPAPVATSPMLADLQHAANGNTTFHVDVLTDTTATIPGVDMNNIYSHARNVASNYIRSGREQEKFIFYRGIGRFQPRILISSSNGDVEIGSRSVADRPLAMFLVHVSESGHGQLMNVPMIDGKATVSAQDVRALEDHAIKRIRKGIVDGDAARNALIFGLTTAGLNNDEATAMVDTWENGYLKVPGLRLLYILPRAEVDSVLPLTITPAPEKLTRVFVGRIEVMLDTDEARILADVLAQRSNFDVKTLGRFAEPTLRRVREVYANSPAATGEMLAVFDKLITAAAHGDDGNGVN